MDLTPYLAASGLRILKGVTGIVHQGKGTIAITKAAVVGVDGNLIRLLMKVVDELKITLSLNSLDTGAHASGSRHFSGCAADCHLMAPVGQALQPVTLLNRTAVRYAEYLLAHGFQAGEGGPHAALLFGPAHSPWNPSSVSHVSHIHTSINPRPGPAAVGEKKEVSEKKEVPAFRAKEKPGQCLSSLTTAAAYFRIAFPPPFPQPKPRCLP